MELGPYQLQVFVSLVVILGAAFAALIFDFLNSNNQQLRELTIEPSPGPNRPANSPATQRPVPAQVAVSVKKDWSALLSRPRATARPSSPVQVRALKQATSPVPAGFHDRHALSRLIRNRQSVSGLVVSIGLNEPPNEGDAIPEAVRKLLQSFIGPDDFACQSGDDEFLLIYPKERGAAAQRRLSFVAQQLWDFQLRSLGKLSILFSWGAVEVRGESIEEAIAWAAERMRETQRRRKAIGWGQGV